MKLAIDTHVLRKQYGNTGMVRLLAETGFDEMDFSFHDWPAEDPLLGEDWKSQAEELKRAMEEFGLGCSQCHAPCDQDGLGNFDRYEPAWLRTERAIRFAGLLGADHITVHSLYIPTVGPEKEWERNRSFFGSFEKICEETGVRIAIENLPIQVTETPEQINRMLEELDSQWYGALLDTGHGMISDISPAAYLNRLNPGSLIGIHVQDMHGHADEHLLPWMGEIRWEEFAKALAETGYRGPMALEAIHFMEHVPENLLSGAHRYAALTGRELIRMTEAAQKAAGQF